MQADGRKRKILLVEACKEPHIPGEELVLRSNILGGMSIRNVVERVKKSAGSAIPSGVSTTSLYGIPMGLAYIASGVDRDRFEIQHIPLIIDAYRFRLDRKDWVEKVRGAGPDLVGMTLNHTADRKAALGMCADIKRISGDIITVLGGVEATFGAGEIMRDASVDYILAGEGDTRFGRLLGALFGSKESPASLRGLHYRERGGVIYTGDEEELVDLSRVSPSYGPMHSEEYVEAGMMANVQTSRGCPYGCSFCCHTAFWGKEMRYRNPSSVVGEIEFLASKGAEVVYFTDSTFTMNEDHVVSILEGVRDSRKARPVLFFETRMDRIDRDICRLLREAGVGIVAIGVEGADEEVLRKTGGKGRRSYAEDIRRILGWLKGEGIEMYASLVVGLPGETSRSIESTRRLVTDLHEDGLFWADAKLAMAFPGSGISADPEKYGVKLTGAGSYLFYDRPGFVGLDGPGEEETVKMHRELVALNVEYVLKKDYIRPKLGDIDREVRRMASLREGRKPGAWYDAV